MNFFIKLAVAASLVCGLSAAAVAEDQAQLMLGAGVFGFGVASDPNKVEGRIEYRFAHGLFGTDGIFRGFKPVVGAAAQSSGSQFVFAGFAAPLEFGPNWEVVLEGGPGYYRQGSSSLFLGGEFEFHVALATSYAISDTSRLGIGIYHISNANFHRKNPGVNSILASWSFRFDGP